MELQFKEKETESLAMETEMVSGHTVVKGTKVVVQDGYVVGYLSGNELVFKANSETERVIRSYNLLWKHDTMDE